MEMHQSLRALLCILTITIFLPACSGDDQEKAKVDSPLDPQLEALEKAKQVDKLIQDADEKRRKQMEEQGL
jgi:hypothetical protein